MGDIRNRVEPPRTGNALELALSSVFELDTGPGNEVLHGLRDEHLSSLRGSGNPGADHHGEPGDLALVQLAFPRVHSRPNLEPELVDALDDSLGAADRPRRPVESGEEPVAGSVLLFSAKACQLAANKPVVPLEQVSPRAVPEPRPAPSSRRCR